MDQIERKMKTKIEPRRKNRKKTHYPNEMYVGRTGPKCDQLTD